MKRFLMLMMTVLMLMMTSAAMACHGETSEQVSSTVHCMCGEPLSPAYACQPEWVDEGRRCDGRCDLPGEDVWSCIVPPGGTDADWAPPNCYLLDPGGGQRRYCCSCP